MVRLHLVAGLASLFACDPQPPAGEAEDAAIAAPDPEGVVEPRTCVVAAPAGVASIVASAGGLVFAVASAEGDQSPLLLLRAHGEGCDLVADDGPAIAAEALLDVDDLGNIYVFPAEAQSSTAISTMLPGEHTGSMVAKVDAGNHVSKLLPANRGIWSFGVSPEGDALWVTACGPSGIFAITGDETSASMTAPETLWEQLPSVLTDERTFWSVGYRTCDYSVPLTPACGHALVRTTPAGSEEVASTIVDLGHGFQQATLSRCGSRVCGLFASGLIVWDAEGEVLRTITPADALALPGERIAQVSGNDHGVYVLLRGERDARVVFVPLR